MSAKKTTILPTASECLDVALTAIPEADQFVAVGIDLAAKDANWGITVISLDAQLKSGTIQCILPFKRGRNWIRPTADAVYTFLTGLKRKQLTTAVALDVPLGWPSNQGGFLSRWQAARSHNTDAYEVTDDRNTLEYRRCEVRLRSLFRQFGLPVNILSVAADKIASAAFEWAINRKRFDLLGPVDVGFGVKPSDLVFIETYPSAFVRLNHPHLTGYKTGKGQGNAKTKDRIRSRRRILRRLRCSNATLRLGQGVWRQLKNSCTEKPSDAFDGFLSSIAAWDYLKLQHGDEELPLSTPCTMVEEADLQTQKEQIKIEGWPLFRLPRRFEEGTVVELFNGKDLDGWNYTAGSDARPKSKVFSVGSAGQRLVCSGIDDDSTIITTSSFSSFELSLEWFIPVGQRLSDLGCGVFLKGKANRSICIQLTQKKSKPFCTVEEQAFDAILGNAIKNSPNTLNGRRHVTTQGQWNRLTIRVENEHLLVYQNGQPVLRLFLYEIEDRSIGLRSQGTQMVFGNVRLKPLSP